MKYTPSKINRWMLLNLPAAWLTGVRLTLINENKCEVKVRFKWINQNKNEWDYLNMTLPQTKYFQKALKNGLNPIYLKLIKY